MRALLHALALVLLSASAANAQGGWRFEPSAEARLSSSVVPKVGVPNSLRIGAGVGALVFRHGVLDLSVALLVAVGEAEKAGHSYRLGAELELAARLPGALSPYVSSGGHFFVSKSTEDRSGGLWRAALGLRVFVSEHLYAGFEPLVVERLPDGPGRHTPLRSRWAYEIVFLTVGYR